MDFTRILRSIFSWRPALGVGIILILVSIAYFLNMQSDIDKFIPIDRIVERLGIDHRSFSYWTGSLGLLAVFIDSFLYSTDLNKSQLSGEYTSKISYNFDEISRIVREHRLLEGIDKSLAK